MKIDTVCVHGYKDKTTNTGAICVPIYQSSTFSHLGVGRSTGYDYSRTQNPTREFVENTVCSLEKGKSALAFSTGMAAVNALMELFNPGDHIIASEDLYGGTIRLFDNISTKNGLIISYVDTGNVKKIETLINETTKAIFIETPTNPMMNVSDLAAIKNLIGEKDILLVTDNTFLTPYFCNPFDLGADIIVHSGTKFLSGHNDTLAGFLVTNNDDIAEKLRYIQKTTGACLSPFDCFLVTRGIKTLALRMEKSQENALTVAEWLKSQSKVKKVYYAGLPEHPSYELSKRQARGFGAMISFEVDSKETAYKILENVKLILFAESLGGVETLITYPFTQTHADVPIEKREERHINERLLRVSVGIENIQDIISDLQQALGGDTDEL